MFRGSNDIIIVIAKFKPIALLCVYFFQIHSSCARNMKHYKFGLAPKHKFFVIVVLLHHNFFTKHLQQIRKKRSKLRFITMENMK